jgi:hypothetical protein
MAAFKELRELHAAMPPEAFNNDHVYKQNLNQVRDRNELGICTYALHKSILIPEATLPSTL